MKLTIDGEEFTIERLEVGFKVTANNVETVIFPYLEESDKIYWRTSDGRTSPTLQKVGEAMENEEM